MAWDFSTEPEFQEKLDWIREFVMTEIEPLDLAFNSHLVYEKTHPVHEKVIRPLQEQVKQQGLWACHLGPDLGGLGYGQLKLGLMNEILGRSQWAPSVFGCQAPDSGNAEILAHYGTDEQKEKWLQPLLDGKIYSAYSMTEPTGGADPTMFKTRAVRDGDHYVIDGQKVWTSRALHSDLMLLLARTTPVEQVKKKTEGLSVFLVDIGACRGKGLEIKPLAAMVNHNTTEVFFDGVRVPAGNLIGQEGKGFRYILDGINAERILVSSEAIGDARWFTRTAVDYSKQRIVFDRPVGQNQGIQFPIARAHAETEAADLVLRKAAALFDAGLPCGNDSNMGKMLAADAAWHAAEACMQTHGGFGYAREYDVERKWRETRLFQIAPVSTNLVLAYIGEHILGMPRSY